MLPFSLRTLARLPLAAGRLSTPPMARVGLRHFGGQSRAVPKGVLTERIADRPLPGKFLPQGIESDKDTNKATDPYKGRKKALLTIPLFLVVLISAGAGFFNYQKLSTSVVASTLYSARINSKCRDVLGDEIQFKHYIPWIWGSINQLHGKIDIEFSVKGKKDWGVLRYKCRRYGGKGGRYVTMVWELVGSDGRVVDLLEEGVEPMEGGAPIKNAS